MKERLKTYKYVYLLFLEAKSFLVFLIKHNASIKTNFNKNKMEYTLLRENHVIEKGLSMKTPKKGFGQEKVLNLLNRLSLYYSTFKDVTFLEYPFETISTYIQYTKESGTNISIIEKRFKQLLKKTDYNINNHIDVGIKEINKKDIKGNLNFNFEEFVNNRHSIRYFSKEVPDIDIINEALEIAQRTPSACNRQSWHSYIFQKNDTQRLLEWQGGSRGFEEEVPMSILVTSDMNAFLHYEPFQPYVDGGMYAMSLIYSLHSQGLGTIPLSTGFETRKIKLLRKIFRIPDNEVPIVIIGIGNLLESFNVAVSKRKLIEQTTTYINDEEHSYN